MVVEPKMMTWLASVARYFNFDPLTNSSGTECGIEQHYEEGDFDSDENDLDAEEDDFDDRDSMTDADESELDSVNGPSQWLGIVYEEEAVHLKERNESLETDEPLLEF